MTERARDVSGRGAENAVSQELFYILAPLGSAWLAGSLIGLEREYHGRPAGFRTHALVCVASALLMAATVRHEWWLGTIPIAAVQTDPTRTAAAIMMGIGFLGAGVIFKEGFAVRGLTTAASVWTTAAVGILYGIGLWLPAIAGTAIVIVTLSIFQTLEIRLPAKQVVLQILKFPRDDVLEEAEVRRILGEHRFTITEMSYTLTDDGRAFIYRLHATTRRIENIAALARTFRALPNVVEFRISPLGE